MCNEIDLSQWELKSYKAGTTGFVRITCKVIEELKNQSTEESLEGLNHIFGYGVALAQIGKKNNEMLVRVEFNDDTGSISMILTDKREQNNG